jgi:hypothetical protein
MSEDSVKLQSDGTLAAVQPQKGLAAPAFPAEAFACPHCGQMLGPGVRVCAACRQPIDPAQIRLPVLPAHAPAASAAPRAPEKARHTSFPWGIFFGVLLGMVLLSAATEAKFGMTVTAYGFGFVQLATSLWVIFDAHRKRVPQPLQWGVGTMLLWITAGAAYSYTGPPSCNGVSAPCCCGSSCFRGISPAGASPKPPAHSWNRGCDRC